MHAELKILDKLSTEIILSYNNLPKITDAKMAATAHFPFFKFLEIFCAKLSETVTVCFFVFMPKEQFIKLAGYWEQPKKKSAK